MIQNKTRMWQTLWESLTPILADVSDEEGEEWACSGGLKIWFRYGIFALNLIISRSNLMNILMNPLYLNVLISSMATVLNVDLIVELMPKIWKR